MIVGWIDNIIPFFDDLKSFLLGDGVFPFVGLFLFIWVFSLFKKFMRLNRV